MTALPHVTRPPLWEPPLASIQYDMDVNLRPRERIALAAYLDRRSDPGVQIRLDRLAGDQPLNRILAPLRAGLDHMGSERAGWPAVMYIFLRECLAADTTFWGWDSARWIHVIGRRSRVFDTYNRTHQGERQKVMGVAYLHGWFRDVLELGPFRREMLARRIFGDAAIDVAIEWVEGPLCRWGYVPHSALRSCLCEVLLCNESPHVEDITAELLDRYRRNGPKCKRSRYFQLARALASRGTITAPLSIAPPDTRTEPVSVIDGVGDEWAQWIKRWLETSTLASRRHVATHLYTIGRWLQICHKTVRGPEDWTLAFCAEFVAATSRRRVGQYALRQVNLPQVGQRLSPNSVASEIGAMRTFFRDCQEWDWIPRRFDPARSLAVPRNVKALIGRKPRVIADNVWARLLWAGLHLEEDDLTSGYAYPLAYVRALVLVWLFSGLRSDEISRLRVGCIRWQQPTGVDSSAPVCILDVPVSKTATEFAKPIDPQVGQAIETWEKVRPDQPQVADRKTGERVTLLFMFRGRAMRPELINKSIIPTLCRKAGVPTCDARGAITSHRARATIASQLFNSREPMSLFELQAWLGHGSPASTQHYVAVTPTRLAKAYSDAGYFERNVRAIEVLIDQDALKQAVAEGEPWRYYDLGHGLCAYEFFDQCAHRMACARCDFYRPRESSLVQLIEAKDNILRFLQEIPLTDDERSAVDGDLHAIDRLAARLESEPTPCGKKPSEIQQSKNSPSSTLEST